MAERARAKRPEKNPFKFEDLRIQRLSDIWFSQRETTSVEQKEAVGCAYIRHILDFGDDAGAAERLVAGDGVTFFEVGIRQSSLPSMGTNLAGFWREVRRIFPGVYRNKDVRYLVTRGRIEAVSHFLNQLDPPPLVESPILKTLMVAAHCFK